MILRKRANPCRIDFQEGDNGAFLAIRDGPCLPVRAWWTRAVPVVPRSLGEPRRTRKAGIRWQSRMPNWPVWYLWVSCLGSKAETSRSARVFRLTRAPGVRRAPRGLPNPHAFVPPSHVCVCHGSIVPREPERGEDALHRTLTRHSEYRTTRHEPSLEPRPFAAC